MLLAFIAACSSSSYHQRYSDDTDKKETRERKSRFSSEEDSSGQTNTTAYSDPAQEKEFDVEPVEEIIVDKNLFVNKYKKHEILSEALTDREKILFEVMSFLDTPYQFGGDSDSGVDCSAFTQKVFESSVNQTLPRTASQQFTTGEKVSSKNLQFGDLVFFNTSKARYPGHVGIYLGENLFAHASRTQGVTISSMNNDYYFKRFVGGRRIAISSQ
ncbi:MAG: C40 family peptidase [Bacteroidetes bacterium]|nr:C40 family peptidase [Bacteroidota bacterium]